MSPLVAECPAVAAHEGHGDMLPVCSVDLRKQVFLECGVEDMFQRFAPGHPKISVRKYIILSPQQLHHHSN